MPHEAQRLDDDIATRGGEFFQKCATLDSKISIRLRHT